MNGNEAPQQKRKLYPTELQQERKDCFPEAICKQNVMRGESNDLSVNYLQ